ncbi:MAG: hypothetical protein AB1327_11625 [Bacillota bacterium]|uniref:anti-sigma factor family protein n=1 Tax=Desulforudis sp. DRI-14 TaxID=3459793 RepID=UPI00348BE966
MRCLNEYEWELYVDGELPAQQQELERHLRSCAACAELVAGLRKEETLIYAAIAGTPLPFNLPAAIERRIALQEARDGWWTLAGLTVVILMAAMLAFFLLWLPLAQKTLAVAGILGRGELLTMTVLGVARAFRHLAGAAVQGGTVLPALTMLVLGLIWVKFNLRRGGFTRA